jgi:hypothetical protein
MHNIADTLRHLSAKWIEDASRMKLYGAASQATALLRAADDLLHVLSTIENDTLSLTDAARESGYSADHLGRLVRRGEIPNAGRPGAPRIRRTHLPRKASVSPSLLREHSKAPNMDTPRRRIARAILQEAVNG